jgi:hypothetical protein
LSTHSACFKFVGCNLIISNRLHVCNCRPVSSIAYVMYVLFKKVVFWDVAPCRSCVNRRFGGAYRLHLQGRKIGERGTSCRLQPPADAGTSPADFFTLKMEAIRSSETSVHTRSTRRHVPEDGIVHSHRRENLRVI